MEQGRSRPWVYWGVLLGLIAALAALPLIKTDVAVRASGLVRPAAERAVVRPDVSGSVARVDVRDNQRVTKSQVLAVIASADIQERIERNRATQRDRLQVIGDLEALVSGGGTTQRWKPVSPRPRCDRSWPNTAFVWRQAGLLRAMPTAS